MNKNLLLKLINYWPPYLGAGIRVNWIDPGFKSVDVVMKLRSWNTNYLGVHFGGSLYSMVDPFLVLMLIKNLGEEYIVWDKAASIRFKKPGKGRVRAEFRLTQEEIDSIRMKADQDPKVEPVFKVSILDDLGEVVAEVEKTLFVCRKDKRRSSVLA